MPPSADPIPPPTASLPPPHPPTPPPPHPPTPPQPPQPPPSYEQTRQAEPNNPRFGRYKSWIQKRARETREERDQLRAAGLVQPGGWDLPDQQCGEAEYRQAEYAEMDDAEAKERNERAENRLSTSSAQLRIANPDNGASTSSIPGRDTRGARQRVDSAASLEAEARKATQRLTKSVAIHRIGGRFSQGIPDRPLCGMVLPTRAGEATQGDERFVLVGTAEGLYLLDLLPSLSSATSQLSLGSASPSGPGEDAAVFSLWTGLTVHHVELFQEPTTGRGDSPKGIVLAQVGKEGEIRMWSLSNLISLAKWRVYDTNSLPLHLPSLTRLSRSSSSAPPYASPGSEHRGSLSHHSPLHSISPSKHDNALASSVSGKGKLKALPQAHSPAVIRTSSTEAEYLLVDPLSSRATPVSPAGFPSATGPSQFPFSTSSSSFPHAAPSSAPAASPSERLALPLEWATSSVPLPLPKGHSPILFFRLFRSPPPASPQLSDDDEDDYDDLTAEQRQRWQREEEDKQRLYLIVATAKSVYLFESKPGGKRSWALTKEFFAPSTPKSVRLVRRPSPPSSHATPAPSSSKTSSHRASPSSSHRGPASASPSLSSGSSHPSSDLHLLLLLTHRIVLIRLSDSSVTELDLAPIASSSSLSSSSHSSKPATGRARSSSSSSLASSSSSVAAAAVKSKHRPSPSLVSLATSVKERVADLPVVAKMAAYVGEKKEQNAAVPVGMRGAMGELVSGRKLTTTSSSAGLREGSRSESGLVGDGGSGWGKHAAGQGKWTSCDVLTIGSSLFSSPSTASSLVQLLLLTRGNATHLLPVPLPPCSSALEPLWTFHWPTSFPPISHITGCFSPLPPSNRARQPEYAHLALTAFSSTGLSVQEGVVPLALLWSLSAPPSLPLPSRHDFGPFFRPLPGNSNSQPTDEGNKDDEEEDLADTATMDFGRETAWLCTSSSSSSTSGESAFFWTQAHSDYAVKRLAMTT
ncbi:hypothetical protein JCM11641_002245 [Rhodosporidiobolus odoratus]